MQLLACKLCAHEFTEWTSPATKARATLAMRMRQLFGCFAKDDYKSGSGLSHLKPPEPAVVKEVQEDEHGNDAAEDQENGDTE